jgi:flagellar biosynthesis protein
MQVELDQHIPPQLYLAVAELLAWLYRLERGETTAIPRTEPIANPLQSSQVKLR